MESSEVTDTLPVMDYDLETDVTTEVSTFVPEGVVFFCYFEEPSEGEKINAEFVKINASDFVAAQPEPPAEELDGQFEQYKSFSPSQITDQNPYGFGYKLPAMIAIEYLVLKLDDVRTLITEPTPNETETESGLTRLSVSIQV